MPSWRMPTLSILRMRRKERERRRRHRDSDSSGLTLNTSSLSNDSLKEDASAVSKRRILISRSGCPAGSRTSRNLFTAASPFRAHTYAAAGPKPRKLSSSRYNNIAISSSGAPKAPYEDSTLFTQFHPNEEPPTESSLSPFFGNFSADPLEHDQHQDHQPLHTNAPRPRTTLTADDVVFF